MLRSLACADCVMLCASRPYQTNAHNVREMLSLALLGIVSSFLAASTVPLTRKQAALVRAASFSHGLLLLLRCNQSRRTGLICAQG
jgi:hypothetical protein